MVRSSSGRIYFYLYLHLLSAMPCERNGCICSLHKDELKPLVGILGTCSNCQHPCGDHSNPQDVSRSTPGVNAGQQTAGTDGIDDLNQRMGSLNFGSNYPAQSSTIPQDEKQLQQWLQAIDLTALFQVLADHEMYGARLAGLTIRDMQQTLGIETPALLVRLASALEDLQPPPPIVSETHRPRTSNTQGNVPEECCS